MNIDELTLGQLREIQKINVFESELKAPMIGSIDFIGCYVIVRSQNEGINAGYVHEYDQTGIVLADARRIWYHKPKDPDKSWYESVAESGLSPDSKISNPVKLKAIIEDYSITKCSTEAMHSIQGHKTNEQK